MKPAGQEATAQEMRLGVDIGGTFTDCVSLGPNGFRVAKIPSTPARPWEGLFKGIETLGFQRNGEVVHGSTVATNAVLERNGARTALIVTRGFRDILIIARQARPELYDLNPPPTLPLVPPELSLEINERVGSAGETVRSLNTGELEKIVDFIEKNDVEAVAVSLLFSFLNPRHEQAVRDFLRTRKREVFVTLSSELIPEYREYERTSTTVINSYVGPVMRNYLEHLERELGPGLRIMQSSGGSISARQAATEPVRTVLSGPAGGVVGAFTVACEAGFDQVITLDMGGTSSDLSLCPGCIQETAEGSIGGFPLRVPVIDIHTIGAGGGSIARLDRGGALLVGPESAGADPGPACYGKGKDATVTDANLLLGRLDAGHFLGGHMTLKPGRSRDVIEPLADVMKVTLEEAASGILKVANASMQRALRVISTERGHDPRRFTLVAFGGAGPLHACDLAEQVGITRVLIPLHPGVLSAYGMLVADVIRDYSFTIMLRDEELSRPVLDGEFERLMSRALADMEEQGFTPEKVRLERFVDMRYSGQSYEITVPYLPQTTEDRVPGPPESGTDRLLKEFETCYARRFGAAMPGEPVEIVNVRLKAVGLVSRPSPRLLPGAGGKRPPSSAGRKEVFFGRRWLETSCYHRGDLRPGHMLKGPSVVFQLDTTILIPPGWRGRVDSFGNIVLEGGNVPEGGRRRRKLTVEKPRPGQP